jgi:hypothetical protein
MTGDAKRAEAALNFCNSFGDIENKLHEFINDPDSYSTGLWIEISDDIQRLQEETVGLDSRSPAELREIQRQWQALERELQI